VTATASFPSRTACGHAGTQRRRGAHTCTKIGTFRNRDRNGQVVGCACVGGKPRTSPEDPFGNIIRLTGTGTIARDNPFRFSTKRTDDTTDLVLYEYRPYSPSLGRWPNRDPLGDIAFLSSFAAGKSWKERTWLKERALDQPYVFCQNDPVVVYDADGCVAPLLIFSVGKAASHAILACYSCSKLYKCLDTAKDYAKRAADGFEEPEDYLNWLNGAKPGSECVPLAKDCGVNVIQVGAWLGARFLILRYEALNPIVK
jgi:RHS repeat-associated protein